MFVSSVCLVIFAAPNVLSAVTKDPINTCSLSEYSCSDGACISADLICDGRADCADGSDEMACRMSDKMNQITGDTILNRSKRQSTCRKNQWRCRDGTCIPFDEKCDGVVNCPDKSDETHPLCRKNSCQSNWFRCTYGACVDGTAPCNGVKECADNSDELLPKCRNETEEIRGQFKCRDGSHIPAANHCDGVKDCADGSDETVWACAAKTCPSYLFQCAYGACVDSGSDCNGVNECADGSDEAAELCGKLPAVTTKPTSSNDNNNKPPSGSCVLPPYPEHGSYVTDIPDALPGQGYQLVNVNVTCHRGYGVVGSTTTYCFNGFWQSSLPECVRMCQLKPHPSVEYRCQVTGIVEGSRACNDYEPTGTIVSPQCRQPNYYSPTTLTFMRCIDGYWDRIARCSPECGRVTPGGEELVVGGVRAKKGELPWHAGIYKKTYNPYMQICGGSLISNNVVISAAHCFWTDLEKKLPDSLFAVAVGKIYRPWNDTHDEAQKSDVKQIHLPPRYQGVSANFQEDIAIVIVKNPFEYRTFIRPVCLNFDINFDRLQLQAGMMGKVAGWGLVAENGKESAILQVVELPYVEVSTCISNSPPDFSEYITSDKICAGTQDSSKALCKGDSGGGLAFATTDKGIQRYYLRGVVSTAPKNDNLCNTAVYTSFTQILKHEYFIKQFWTES